MSNQMFRFLVKKFPLLLPLFIFVQMFSPGLAFAGTTGGSAEFAATYNFGSITSTLAGRKTAADGNSLVGNMQIDISVVNSGDSTAYINKAVFDSGNEIAAPKASDPIVQQLLTDLQTAPTQAFKSILYGTYFGTEIK
jgi:hypothetical protein